MERRSIQVLKPWSAFVLYSLTTLNGEEYDIDGLPEEDWPDGVKTEFWVKGLNFDVKVHEIPLEIEVQAGWKCVNGVCEYSETDGVYATQAECEAAREPIYGGPTNIWYHPEWTGGQEHGVLYRVTVSTRLLFAGLVGQFTVNNLIGPIGQPYGEIQESTGRPNLCQQNFYQIFLPHGGGNVPIPYSSNINQRGMITYPLPSVCFWPYWIEHISVTRMDGLPDNSGDPAPGPIVGYNCGSLPTSPPTIPNPYEAFLSYSKPKVFTLIKSNLNDEDEEFGELKYQSLVDGTLANLGQSGHADDWRKDAVILTPTASIEIEDSNPCLRDFLTATNATLNDGNLYTLDLNQSIGVEGDALTLKTLLESDPGEAGPKHLTVDTMIVHARPDNDNPDVCQIGTGTPLPCRIPVPGRGNVLGVAVMPK